MSEPRRTFLADFRQFFGRGLAVLLPSILTLWLLWTAFGFVFKSVAVPINRGIQAVVIEIAPRIVEAKNLPEWFVVSDERVRRFRQSQEAAGRRDISDDAARHELRVQAFREVWNSHWYLQGTGLVVAIVLIYLAGLLLGGLIGRRLYARVERLISRIPGFKQVYPHVKQLVELVMGDKPMAFKRVVLVPYPRQGILTLGFVTGDSFKSLSSGAGVRHLAIFIPSTPTPFTGFTINVPESDVVDLPITIDEAIRFVLTGGVLKPDRDFDDKARQEIAQALRLASKGKEQA